MPFAGMMPIAAGSIWPMQPKNCAACMKGRGFVRVHRANPELAPLPLNSPMSRDHLVDRAAERRGSIVPGSIVELGAVLVLVRETLEHFAGAVARVLEPALREQRVERFDAVRASVCR